MVWRYFLFRQIVADPVRKRLLLIGGGHAHLEVLRSLRVRPLALTEIVLVSSGRHTAYSGMVPGFLSGQYRASDIRFDLEALATSCGGRVIDAANVVAEPSAN